MKKYILLLIGSFFVRLSIAQSDKIKQEIIAKEIVDFATCFENYTTIKKDFTVRFDYLDSTFFKWNVNGKVKFIKVEELLNKLEQNNQPNLVDLVKKDYLDFFRRLYESYESNLLFRKRQYDSNYRPWKYYPYIVLNDSIINISKCDLKKTINGYTLYNKKEISKNILDYWSVSDWENEIPISKINIEKEIHYYYYNYQDSTILGYKFDSLRTEIVKKKNKLNTDINSLINSSFYKGSLNPGGVVPSILSIWISEYFKELKNYLPEEWKLRINDIKLNYEITDQKKLWFVSDKSDLYISPYLIRAVYIIFYNRFKEGFFNNISDLGTNKYTLADIKGTYRMIKNGFQNNFHFLILHELAHQMYNGKEKKGKIEELCDCKALEIIKANKLQEKLGVFEDILIQVVKENKKELWDIENENDILERLKKLKKPDNSFILQNCDLYLK